MRTPPQKIDSAKVLLYAIIDERQKPTGNTRHFVGSKLVGVFPRLAICQYESNESCYLFYCDKNWETITDTFHDSLDEAKRHAEFEYEGVTETWQTL